VAREGDTVATVAARVGGSAEEIARRNGLPPDYALRAGEVLVLPEGVPRLDGSATGWSPDIAAAAIDGAPQAPRPRRRRTTRSRAAGPSR
jgi:LysM repeat protein